MSVMSSPYPAATAGIGVVASQVSGLTDSRALRVIAPVISLVTGANVAEDQVDAVLHVNANHPSASDPNPGTERSPLKSISRGAALALANRSKGLGTKILIAPGVYRDAVRLPQHGKDLQHPRAEFLFDQMPRLRVSLTEQRRRHIKPQFVIPLKLLFQSVQKLWTTVKSSDFVLILVGH